MATFTLTADTNIDALIGKTGGDSYYTSGFTLTVDQDSRYGLNTTTTTGSIGVLWYTSGKFNTYQFDARKVRLIPFNNGSGTIPALNTLITQGSASGKLISVYTALNAAPLTSGTMPASGWLKIKQWNDIPYTAGALSGISADATGVDTAGWLEIVFDNNGRLDGQWNTRFNLYGEWYEIGTTTGDRASTYQIPTNGSPTNIAGVWIEDSPGSGNYIKYPNAISTKSVSIIASDALRGQWSFIGDDGVLRLGNNGVADSGYCPTSGCKIRIGNLFFQMCTTAARNTNVSLVGLTTEPTSSPGFSSPGIYTFDKANIGFVMPSTFNPTQVLMTNTGVCDGCASQPNGKDSSITNCMIGSLGKYSRKVAQFLFTYNIAYIIDDIKVAIHVLQSDWQQMCGLSYSNNIEIKNSHYALLTQRSAANPIFYTTSNYKFVIQNCILGGGGIYVQGNSLSSTDPSIIDGIQYYDSSIDVTTTSTAAVSVVYINGTTANLRISNISFPILNSPCYNSIVNITSNSHRNIDVHDIGSSSSPINCNNITESPYKIDYNLNNCDNVKVRRIFSINQRSTAQFFGSSLSQSYFENSYTSYAMTIRANQRNTRYLAVRGTLTPGFASYSALWHSLFNSDTTGKIYLAGSTPVPELAATQALTNVERWDVGFYFPAGAYGSVITTSTVQFKGFSAFAAAAVTYSTWPFNNPEAVRVSIQIDTGSGFGEWIEATAANLGAITNIDSAVGFYLKVKIEQIGAAATFVDGCTFNMITSVADQYAGIYPLDVSTLQINNMVAGSMVKVTKVSDGTVLYTGPSSNISVEYAGDVRVVVRKGTGSPTYKQWDTICTLVSNKTTTITALQEPDE